MHPKPSVRQEVQLGNNAVIVGTCHKPSSPIAGPKETTPLKKGGSAGSELGLAIHLEQVQLQQLKESWAQIPRVIGTNFLCHIHQFLVS